MEELGREISLCLRYYSVTFRGQRPTRLRLVGGEACDPQLQALLNSALVIPVEVARPLYSVNTSRMKPADRRGTMCEWALALGLSLRTTRDYFGPRDGKPRDPASYAVVPAAPAPIPAPAAEVVDLTAALRQADAATGTTAATAREHEATTAVAPAAPAANPGVSLLAALANTPAAPAPGEPASAGGSPLLNPRTPGKEAHRA